MDDDLDAPLSDRPPLCVDCNKHARRCHPRSHPRHYCGLPAPPSPARVTPVPSAPAPPMAGRARTATCVGTPSSHGRRLAVRVRASDESDTATEAAPKVMDAPPKSKPGVGKPPINPLFLAAGDFAAAVLITLVARGRRRRGRHLRGYRRGRSPFVVGWVGAGYLAGDYDADSPNAALWATRRAR